MTDSDVFFRVIRSLWQGPIDAELDAILPRTKETLADFYANLRQLVGRAQDDSRYQVSIDPAAIVRGQIVCAGPDSVIEAGAIVHDSCRVVLGARSRIRSGAVLRNEVIVGPDCLIGAHSEVFRSVLIGPQTLLGHYVLLADSIVGRDVSVAGKVVFASSMVKKGKSVPLHYGSMSLDSGRSHLGALVGDDVRFGAATTLCPGSIVMSGLTLPPHVVIHGTVDQARRSALMKRFFDLWVSP